MKTFCLLVVSLLSLPLLAPASQAAPQPELPLTELAVGEYRIEAEVADTPETRQRGLMYREFMAEDRGMIFVFDHEARHCMWMKNTLIPLSVAFIDAEGRILNIERMHPRGLQLHYCARRPALYALEMNLGWFAERGVGPGERVGGLERRSDDPEAPAPLPERSN